MALLGIHRMIAAVLGGLAVAAAPLGVAKAQPSDTSAAPAQPSDAPAQTPDAQVRRDLDQLADRLSDENASQTERDEAARRLVTRQNPDARAILLRVLKAAGNRAGQLAVAKALVNNPQPSPEFIDPLFALMGPDRLLTDAAAQALGNYRNDNYVFGRLASLAQARQQREPRIAAIRALSTMLEKRSAQVLVTILGSEDETDAVRNAAADALVSMTGLSDNGRDVQRWQQWWASTRDRSEADWRLALLDSRAARFRQVESHLGQLRDEVQGLLTSQYQTLDASRRPEALMRYLRSTEPVIRSTGAQIVFQDWMNRSAVPSEIKQQLLSMIGDSAPEVRVEVARTWAVLNDPAALEPLLTQLAQESDPDVRVEIAKALSPMDDLRAVPALVRLLSDPSYRVADAAARALQNVGPTIRQKDPQLIASVSAALRQIVEGQARTGGSATLRESAVEAMVPLRDPTLFPLLSHLLDQRMHEPAGMRRAAIEALGELHDPKLATMIADSLGDRDEPVRLAAVRSLGKTASAQNAEAIYQQTLPANEPSGRVREEAWRVFQSLLADMAREQLQQWTARFANDPERKLMVLQQLAAKQTKDKDLENLAYTQQDIGEAYDRLQDPTNAALYYRQALDYWRRGNQEGMTTLGLIKNTIKAMVDAGEYDSAAKLGAQLIASDMRNQEPVGSEIRAGTNRLLAANKLDDVVALVGECEKMDPALDSRYMSVLRTMRDDAQQKIAARQRGPASGGPRSARLAPASAPALSTDYIPS